MYFLESRIVKGVLVIVAALVGIIVFKAPWSKKVTQIHSSPEATPEAKIEQVESPITGVSPLPAEARWIEDEGRRFEAQAFTQIWNGEATGTDGLPFWKLQEMVQDPAYPFEEVWEELQKYSLTLPGHENLISSLMRRCALSGDGVTAFEKIEEDITNVSCRHRIFNHLYDKRPPDSRDPLFKSILDVVTKKDIALSSLTLEYAVSGLFSAMEGDPLEQTELWGRFATINHPKVAHRVGSILANELASHHPEYRSAQQALSKLNELLAEWGDAPMLNQLLEGSLLTFAGKDPVGSLQLEIDNPSILPDSVLKNVADKLQRNGKYSVLLERFDSLRGSVTRDDLFANWAHNDLSGLKDWLDTTGQSASIENKDHAKANLLVNTLEPSLEGFRNIRQEIAKLDTAEVRSHHLEKVDQQESQHFVAEFNARPSEILGLLIGKESVMGTAAASEVIQHYLNSSPAEASEWLQIGWSELPSKVQTRVAQESAANALENGHITLAESWLDSLPQTKSE